ncbi:hypothetical protein Q31b_35510 [Novipirellula aureliae]|uniref:DUF1778 domain-containing protein n=1 Tax=Novipirellula aureliae TaxID=2527966 RepID=A0A5C6DYR7_9BACT|nr:DUF1778 domain-containing protein [Novipirellula aureliae]TWU40206.1 hypothetical protein Q31b_35510 [Novipirellula aureliae]
MSSVSDSKSTRLNIRVSEHEKDVISRAAIATGATVSGFVLERAYAEAQAILADQSQFHLDEKQWKRFCKALDAPPKKIPAMRKLLLESGVFDD